MMNAPSVRAPAFVVVACNTLEDEIHKAQTEAGLAYPVVWLEAGYHNQPDRLRAHLNEALGRIKGADRVLMALGHCGGACAGLEAFDFELVIPRTDDCLSLLLGSLEARQRASKEASTYFLTAGWLRHTENLITSFERDRVAFGRERAERIYQIMLKHYQRFGFIDTGTYDLDQAAGLTRPLTELLPIATGRLPGNLAWLGRLLTGPWNPDEFIIVPPGGRLTAELWHWAEECAPQLS